METMTDTTATTNLGLKSINDRLANLEKNMSFGENKTQKKIDIEGNLLEKLKSATVQTSVAQQTFQMNQIQQHFHKGLSTSVPKMDVGVLSHVIEYTVNYVEQNIGVIAKVLGSNVSGALKLQTAITFVCEYFDGLDKGILQNWINHMVDLLFNRKAHDLVTVSSPSLTTTVVEPLEKKTQKNNTLSKKLGRLLTSGKK